MLPIINLYVPNTNSTSSMNTATPNRPRRRTNKILAASPDWVLCSQQSILTAMDRFVKSVNNMDSTVLVPSKLRDMDHSDPKMGARVPPALTNTDLHSFYLMLNDIKKELVWGGGSNINVPPTSHNYSINGRCLITPNRTTSSSPNNSVNSMKITCPPRQMLEQDSLGSSASSTMSDTDSEVDSMITDRDSIDEAGNPSHIGVAFRHHLQGLHSMLHQLADSADYLSTRYQTEIEEAKF